MELKERVTFNIFYNFLYSLNVPQQNIYLNQDENNINLYINISFEI